jgi:hypothetical protein
MPSSAGTERRRASCEQPELIEYDRGRPPATSLKGTRAAAGRLRQRRHGPQNNAQNNDSDGRGNHRTAFPNPSTISNATVSHDGLLGRLKRSDIDFFLCSVDASILQVHPVD